jgi:hypothetical protein
MPQSALPKCQGNARAKWPAARSAELLPVPYFHVVFTLPHSLPALALQNKRLLYDLLYRTSAATMLELARDPKQLAKAVSSCPVRLGNCSGHRGDHELTVTE